MITSRCDSCRLVWSEDRGKGDSPVSPHAFVCPRCGHFGEQFHDLSAHETAHGGTERES